MVMCERKFRQAMVLHVKSMSMKIWHQLQESREYPFAKQGRLQVTLINKKAD